MTKSAHLTIILITSLALALPLYAAKDKGGTAAKAKKPASAAEVKAAQNELQRTWDSFVVILQNCIDGGDGSPTSPTGAAYTELFADQLKDYFKEMRAAVTKAQAAGVADDFRLECSTADNKARIKAMSFAEVKRKMPDWQAIANNPQKVIAERASADEAADQATYGAYYQLLTGDKLAVFKGCKNCSYYTSGKVELASAQAFAGAAVWYTASFSEDYPYAWRVHGIRFQGDKIAQEWDEEGTGSRYGDVPAWPFK